MIPPLWDRAPMCGLLRCQSLAAEIDNGNTFTDQLRIPQDF